VVLVVLGVEAVTTIATLVALELRDKEIMAHRDPVVVMDGKLAAVAVLALKVLRHFTEQLELMATQVAGVLE
jgi:hypothetical protein